MMTRSRKLGETSRVLRMVRPSAEMVTSREPWYVMAVPFAAVMATSSERRGTSPSASAMAGPHKDRRAPVSGHALMVVVFGVPSAAMVVVRLSRGSPCGGELTASHWTAMALQSASYRSCQSTWSE